MSFKSDLELKLAELSDISLPDEDKFRRIERFTYPVTYGMQLDDIINEVVYQIGSIAREYNTRSDEVVKKYWMGRVIGVIERAARDINKWYGTPLNHIPFYINALYTEDDNRPGKLELIITIEEETS